MGKMIEKIILSRGLEYAGWTESVTETDPALAKECVCIDFTTPAAFRANYRFLAENFKAVVVGTTGWADIKDEVIAYFDKCGTPMIWASNFSIGVNVFFAVTDCISRMLGSTGGYSPYMVEMHHCHKLDAPSGTARSLADIVDDDKSQVSVIGKNIVRLNGMLKKTFTPLKKCNVYMISQGASFVNIGFVVDREELSEVVQDLHDHLFDQAEELETF